ncbi:MAG TPA: magnesium/cobalt transporter CorA [Arenicellales bacterium]|nr:magnesium/cobalt transporter CorA [Arenicellales bacterium]
MRDQHRLFSRKKVTHQAVAPGTLVEPEGAPAPVMTVTAYDRSDLVEETLEKPEDVAAYLKKYEVVWVNVDGLGDVELLERLGVSLGLHALALEDVLNTRHRPKVEVYDDNLFVVTRMARIRGEALDIEQVSLFLGKRLVVSFQERPGDCFDPVRERIRKGGTRLRFLGADYLAYALIDAIVDAYFPVLEHYSECLNEAEDRIVADPENHTVERIHELKRDFQVLRHGVWPFREVLRDMSDELPYIREETKLFLRDCHDHVIQVVDILETYRERAAGLTDLYMSSLSNRLNEVMKVLTIIATIFIPLSFVAGLYGMNFDPDASPLNMPELRWYLGYPFALAMMALVAIGLLYYFRRKGWIGGRFRN